MSALVAENESGEGMMDPRLMNAGKIVKDDDALEEATKRPGTMLNTASHRPIAGHRGLVLGRACQGYHPELLSSLVFTLRKSHCDSSWPACETVEGFEDVFFKEYKER